MRALLCKEWAPYDRLSVETVDDPVPGEGEVLVDVKAAGVNFMDLLIVQGKYQDRPPLPFVPGTECAGVVTAVGPGVSRVREGQAVVGMVKVGAFAEKVAIPEARTLPIPEGMSFETAAAIPITYGTSYHALKQRARLAPGETLLVLGAAGGVGLAAVELGKAMGATVIAAASTEAKLEAARAAGADHGLDYCREPLKERIKELTGKKGADVICDPIGGEASEQALRASAWDGRLLVIGFASGEIPKIPLNLALLKGAQIIGVFWGSWIEREPQVSAQNFRELWGMFQDGRLTPRVSPCPLADFRSGFATLAERRAVGKVVLTPSGD